jgi:predicted nucleotidyltransferase
VHTAVVLGAKFLGDVRKEAEVDVVGDERCEGCKTTAKSVQNFEQRVQGVLGVLKTVLALKTATVEANIPVGSVVNELLS